MKERPIIMGAESVRAILEGRKTQTRRVVKKCCPYGKVGDRLWVKESFAEVFGGPPFGLRFYRADGETISELLAFGNDDTKPDWKSPLFMPREASRITLEITDIRVERLQDITEDDALAEGVISNEEYESRASEDNLFPCPRCKGYQVHEAFGYDYGITEVDCTYCDTQKKRYRIVWDSLNAKRGYPWESNPWVWAVSFKVVKNGKD